MKLKSLFAGLSLLGIFGSAHAALGSLDTVPAATLLAPYFEVDTATANGLRSQITVSNASNTEQVARVTLWSDRGVPVFGFDIRLDGNGTVEVNLRDLLVNGTLPTSTAGGVGSCSGVLPYAALNATTTLGLRNALSGQASSLLAGQCASDLQGSARGFVTIDAANSCTASNTVFPTSVGYFADGGLGLASNNNVLFGEYAFVDSANGRAYGDALISIEAGVASGNTFYGLMANNGSANNREPLTNMYTARFSNVSGTVPNSINRTAAIVWRDPGLSAPFACGTSGPQIPDGFATLFDHQEQPTGTFINATALSRATQYLSQVGSVSSGNVVYDLRTTNIPERQGFASHIAYTNGFDGGNSAEASMYPATAYDTSLSVPGPTFQFGPCSDGIDNDADGLVDFPADPGCFNANSNSENPACSDGLDNDSDGQSDFPADTSCANRFQEFEVTECSDGLDNDANMFTDFPTDPNCRSAADISEFSNNNQCSDGFDNNGNGLIDFPFDPLCNFPGDPTESSAACLDGFDNDNDGLVDFPTDPGCTSTTDFSETVEACSDGLDNDSDGQTDFPNDRGCTSPNDNNEVNPACIDGIDNDGDSLIDFPNDLGCSSATDDAENFGPCDDGFDNDGDMLIDFPADPGCASAASTTERPQCNDTFDNDFDGLTDFPNDPQCASASQNTEEGQQCNDGIDNDGDGLTDFPASPNCTSATDPSELPECSDGLDNDNDGLADFTGFGVFGADPGCGSATDGSEFASATLAACSDGQDNDGDGFVDYPADPGCAGAGDTNEFALTQVTGGVGHPIPAASSLSLIALILSLMGLAGLALHRRQAS